MSCDYICPFCKGHLRVDKDIIFLTKTRKGEAALVLLSPELGDYNYKVHPSVKFTPGDLVNFICPICYENLDAKEYETENLAKVLMLDENKKEYTIVFSKIVGQTCTYKISEDSFEAYGPHLDEYINFFGDPEQ